MTDLFNDAMVFFPLTQALRRDFHRHPELGFQEHRTASIVVRELKALGLETHAGVGQTGVVSLLEGKHPGPVVMLRFDMDALPIQEQTGADYASETPGVMHACGHDGHTAIGLGVARLLIARRDQLHGTVKFVFQPGEEGMGGAEAMITDGVLENPKPDLALGLHLWNDKPLGWLGIASGPIMAAGDVFKVRLRGRGGHGAIPQLAIDPIVAAGHIVVGLQSIVSRNVSPLQTAVVTVGAIHGGEAFNVIPQEVELRGTIRTFDASVRDLVLVRFIQIVETIANAYGCKAEIDLKVLTPAVVNETGITEKVQKVAESLFPTASMDTFFQTMGSEDMAYFLQRVPGCFFFVGSANSDKGFTAAHHHPKFDFDEDALHTAVILMTSAVLEFLK